MGKAEDSFRAGRLAAGLEELQAEVRQKPADVKLRIFLAQLLMMVGQWERAVTQLSVIENDISEALAYLDSCQTCSTDYAPTECGACNHQGHQKGEAPPLFAGLSRRPSSVDDDKEFDVPVTGLSRDPLTPREGSN